VTYTRRETALALLGLERAMNNLIVEGKNVIENGQNTVSQKEALEQMVNDLRFQHGLITRLASIYSKQNMEAIARCSAL
jgi:hypothetical protein